MSARGQLASAMLALAWSAGAAAADPWAASIDATKKERFIPVELWTGAQWDGSRELAMKDADGSYGYRRVEFTIKGPAEWKHPVTGDIYRVYERINPGAGMKKQLFTLNPEKSGLGRVYDVRPGSGIRTFSGGLKFPLGLWREGETRSLSFRHFSEGVETTRVETITLRRIDLAFQGARHCIDFDWKVTDGSGRRVYDTNNYVYCPGRSMAGEGMKYRSPDPNSTDKGAK